MENFTDAAVLVEVDANDPETSIRKDRLGYYRRLILHAPGILWALLKLEDERGGSFLDQCRQDMRWLQQLRPDKVPTQDPAVEAELWAGFVEGCGGWRGIVKHAALLDRLCRAIHTQVADWKNTSQDC